MQVDILIVGGGIAGLWALAQWRALGYQAWLVSDELGKGQSIASQGIIHGGTKYALTGQMSSAALAIGAMPTVWRNALAGQGVVDLRSVRVLAEHQLLWTSGGMGARLTGFFASHLMQSRMTALARSVYPPLFKTPHFKGALYQLDEPVLDIPDVLTCLQQQLVSFLIAVEPLHSYLRHNGKDYEYVAVLPDGSSELIQAQHIILTAGVGNEALMKVLPPTVGMQRRPLHMIMLRGALPTLYAHALGMSDKPRLTITSHQSQGQTVWYIGGQPAEQGVDKTPTELIQSTALELQMVLPWLDLTGLEWATWAVDRAEATQANGVRPDRPSLHTLANVTVAWPTKLAFAPLLADELVSHLRPAIKVSAQPPVLRQFTVPPVARPLWEQGVFQCSNVH